MPREHAVELGEGRLSGPGDRVLAAGRHERGDLAGRSPTRQGPDQRRRTDGAGAAFDGGERARPPTLVARHVRVDADDQGTGRLGQVEPQLGAALDDRRPVGEVASEQLGTERRRLLLAGAGGSANPLDLEREHGQDEGQGPGVGFAAVLEDGAAGGLPRDGQGQVLEIAANGEQAALLVTRAGGNGEHRSAAVRDDQPGVERAGHGAREGR